jgi:hypothetical protein
LAIQPSARGIDWIKVKPGTGGGRVFDVFPSNLFKAIDMIADPIKAVALLIKKM